MVLMAGLQVFIVRFFFNGARKGESTVYQYGYLSLTMLRIRIGDCCTKRTGSIDRSGVYHSCNNHNPSVSLYVSFTTCFTVSDLFSLYYTTRSERKWDQNQRGISKQCQVASDWYTVSVLPALGFLS